MHISGMFYANLRHISVISQGYIRHKADISHDYLMKISISDTYHAILRYILGLIDAFVGKMYRDVECFTGFYRV